MYVPAFGGHVFSPPVCLFFFGEASVVDLVGCFFDDSRIADVAVRLLFFLDVWDLGLGLGFELGLDLGLDLGLGLGLVSALL